MAVTREYVKILALYAEPGGESLLEVRERALALRCFSLEAVKLLLFDAAALGSLLGYYSWPPDR